MKQSWDWISAVDLTLRNSSISLLSLRSRGPIKKSVYKVFLGKSILNVTDDKEQVFMVDEIISHPDFTDETGGNENDIGKCYLNMSF